MEDYAMEPEALDDFTEDEDNNPCVNCSEDCDYCPDAEWLDDGDDDLDLEDDDKW